MSEIEAGKLKDRLESGEPVEVLDIREADEFAAWHIHGSRNLPVYDALRLNDTSGLVEGAEALPRDRPIVAVCRAGFLSQRAADLLRTLGYEATSLQGGIRAWGRVWTEAPIELRDGVTFVQIRRNSKGCLSYLFGANGEAAVVDPSVEIEAYLDAAKRHGLRVTHVLETHVHADHISRARALCSATGAELCIPPNQRVTFSYKAMENGATIEIGGLTVETIATPGHTGESSCYLVDDAVLLTGDTLFAESVGRPDLEKGDAGAETGARTLHGSLHERLLGRFEDLPFYACHVSAAIGFDGVPLGGRLAEARTKMELLQVDENAFVERIVGSLTSKPGNFETIIAVNEGKADLGGDDPLDLEAGPNRCAAG